MEREHGRRKNRSAEKHGVMTNGGFRGRAHSPAAHSAHPPRGQGDR